MKKKALVFGVAAMLGMISVLGTGCGKAENTPSGSTSAGMESSGETSGQGSSAEAGGAAGENVSFDWFLTASALPEIWDLEQPIFKAITDATGCTPKVTVPAEDADTKLNLMLTNNNLPDLMTLGNDDLIFELIEADKVWDLGEFMQTYLPESHIFTDYPEDVKNEVIRRYGGWYFYSSHIVSDDAAEIWGYPEGTEDYYEAMKYSDQFSIFISSEYAKQLNIDVKSIDTEEKLLDVMKQFKEAGLKNEAGADVYTLVIPVEALEEMNMRPLKYQFGTLPYDEAGNYRSEYYAPQYRHAVEFLNQCYREGYLDQNIMTLDSTSMKTICNSGRAAVYIGGISGLNMGHDDEWETPGPVLSSTGDSPVFPISGSTSIGWLKTFVSKDCENPEAIARFIDYMSGREGMLVHMYGIEGDDYTWDEHNMLHRTDSGSGKVEDSVSGMFGFYAFHHTSFSRSIEYIDMENVSDLQISLGSSDKVFKYNSSLFNLPAGYVEAGSDYAFIKNEVNNYVESTLPKIMMAADEDTFNSMFDEFISTLDSLGLPDYDEYVNIAVQEAASEAGVDLKQEQPHK
ncbi:MAG: extracellular solute-binding protein [Lachnospiraceae bacterium]|nr:extracellular solute-binding protein [Lachnospiraceae bacterium]